MSTTAVVVIIIVVAVALLVIVAGVMMARRASRRRQLQARFGSEYERAMHASGNSKQAEVDLQARADEREKLAIRPLNDSQRNRYALDWQQVQTEFVDAPALSLGRADALITDVMIDRGYPMQDFDRQANLISVDHSEVVEHYRRAHEIFVLSQTGEASTEDLRQGFVSYRRLFDELLEASDSAKRDVPNGDDSRSILATSDTASPEEADSVRRIT
jgi:type II secretory pathway pseudopilin PulG